MENHIMTFDNHWQGDCTAVWERDFERLVEPSEDMSVAEHCALLADLDLGGNDVDLARYAAHHGLDERELRLGYLSAFGRAEPWVGRPIGRRHPVRAEALLHRTRPPDLVEGWMGRNEAGLLVGASGSGKSFLVLWLLIARAVGRPWLGASVEPGASIYVPAEGSAGLPARLRAAYDFYGVGRPIPVTIWEGSFNLTTDAGSLAGLAADTGSDLIVVDTFGAATRGIDENSPRDMGEAVNAIIGLRDATRACVLLTHHPTKTQRGGNRTQRGHGRLLDDLDFSVEIRANRLVESTKERDRPRVSASFSLVPHPPSLVATDALALPNLVQAPDDRSAVLAALKTLPLGEHAKSDVAKAMGVRNTAATAVIDRFVGSWDTADADIAVRRSGRSTFLALRPPVSSPSP